MDADDVDQKLFQRQREGDEIAFEQLYDRHSASAYGLALRITNDRSLAQDVVQEAFLSLWRSAATFDEHRASVRTWLLSITHHRAVDVIRKRRQPTVPLDQLAGAPIVEPALRATDIWPLVGARLDSHAVRTALESIAEPQRVALQLAYFGGLTQTEIATRTGVPLGTVKSRVRLGLVRLGALLEIDTAPDRAPAISTTSPRPSQDSVRSDQGLALAPGAPSRSVS